MRNAADTDTNPNAVVYVVNIIQTYAWDGEHTGSGGTTNENTVLVTNRLADAEAKASEVTYNVAPEDLLEGLEYEHFQGLIHEAASLDEAYDKGFIL
mgnify:CR=1 FL=1|tara:strand:+ start:8338 stop:8628 length:291 start_codon:yes stop_codon:yes gene_type:complete